MLDKDLAADEKRTLIAHVCDRALLFKTARQRTNLGLVHNYYWSSTGLDWSDYAQRAVYVSRDTVAPTLSHISVAGTSVVLTFSEALGAASGLANSAFTVMKTVQSVEETLTLSAAPVISGAAVTLTLSAAVESIDTVTVRYDKPDSGSNNKLADRTDNEVEDFTTEADAAPHVVSIARQNPSASPTNASSLIWRVTFSKDVSNVDATDFQVSGTTATPTDVTEVTASTVYDVTASGGNLAGLDAPVTLMFATGQNIADTDGTALAGTAPTGTNESTWVVDNTAPRVTSIARQTPASSPTNADSLTWRVTFDEDVANVDATGFEVSGTAATPTAVSEVTASTVYDVTVSGGNLAALDATVTLTFAAGQDIADTAGNALANTTPTGANDNDYVVDNVKPTVTITGVPMTSTAAFTATITFLEPVNGFAVGDITVGNGTAAAFTGSEGDTEFTALITPTADGAVTVDVAADVATDAMGNGNTAAAQASSTYTAPLDNTAPRVTSIARQTPASSPTNADSLTWRVTFSEDVENVDATDFEVSGTTATPTAVSEVTASTVYDVTVSGGNLGSLDAPVTLAFVAGQDIDDPAGNALASTAPTGANENGFVVDNTAPRVVSIERQTPSSPTNASSLTWRVTFSEDVENVDETDFTVSNTIAALTTAAVAGSSAQYDVTAAGGDLGSLNTLVTLAFVAGQDIDDPVGHALASTAPTGANESTWVVDNTAPRVTSIARQTPSSSPTNADSLTWRVTFNEDVENVDTMDFAVTGTSATPTAVSEVTASTVYDVTVSGGNLADRNAPVTLTFAAGQNIADTAGNALSNTTPTGTNDIDYVVDNAKPTVTITGVPMTGMAAFTATITFLEPVNGFVVGDITVGNGTAASFTGSDGDTAFTALITPTADGAVTVDVAADVATDAAGNGNTAAAQASSVFDFAPRVTSIARQTPASSPTNADSLTWRVTFNEDVENVDTMDFEVSGTTATPTAVSEVTASTVYDVTVSGGNLADRNATVTLAFAAGRNIADTADNALSNTTPTGTNDNAYVVDNAKPTVTITGVPMTSTAAFTATITFLEPVNGFVVGDITVGNGTAASFTGSDGDTAFTALITPTADGAVTVDVAADVATDAAGNGNTAAAQVSSVFDSTAPRVTSIARQTPSSSPTNADSLTWRVTFNEDVKNVDAMDFEVSGTTATPTAVSEVTASTVYDVTVSGGNLADRNATVTLAFAAGQDIADTADNALSNTTPTGATDNAYVVDNTKPTVTITGVPMTSTAAFTATITFLEPVNGFVVGDITVGNGTASSFTGSDGDTAFTALISPTADGPVTVDVAADVATDAAGNGNTAAAQVSSVFDSTAPRVTSIARQTPSSSPTNADSLTWRVTFNEDVKNVDAMDFEVSGTTATPTAVSEVTASTVYDVTVSGGNLADRNATVTLAFAAGRNIADTADNALSNTTPTGTNDNAYVVDNAKPTVTITGVPMTSTAAFTATITFLEPVNGFVVGDITVGNGTAASFTGSDGDTAFTALITPTADGAVTVDVAADVATDAAGNGNTAAAQVSSVFDSTAPRVTSIARQTPSSSPTNADSLTWRVTFNEDVKNVDAMDFEVSGTTATPTAVSEVTASTVYDVTVSGGNLADRNATVTLAFAAGQDIADTADNALSNTTPTGATDNAYVVDNAKPTVTITGVPMTSTAAFTATITFLEPVNGFVVGDITVGNGTAASFTGSEGDTEFTALITPTADGAVTVDVAADVATDAAGNGNTAAAQVSSTYTAPLVDNTAPRVTSIAISPEPPRASEEHGPFYTKEAFLAVPDGAVHGPGATLTFTLTFSRDVTVTPDPDSRAQPELVLDVFGRERRARYTGGSGTQELTFVWKVEKGDNDPDGLEVQQLALNGATIRDSQDRDTEPETFPSARHKAYRVRGGLHAMWLVVTGSAREGAPFTVKVQRDGGFDELAHAIVRMTDSGMEDPAPGQESAQNHGFRLMSFPFDARSGEGADPQFSVGTVTPPGDGVADARTLTLQLFATDVGDSGVSYWYVAGDPVEVTVRVADTGLAKDTPALSARNAWMREPRPAEAERDAVVALLFDVVLEPAATERVMVDYETRNGTAFAGEDYETKSGTLTFEPGETLKTVEVRVLDDTHDEGSETMRLVLSNARGAAITDAEATGTINNTDPMPKSWLARFGRTASDHVVQAIADRWRDGEPQTHFTLGGRQVDNLFRGRDALGGALHPTATGNPALRDESTWARMDRLRAEALAGSSLAGSRFAGGGSAGRSSAGSNVSGSLMGGRSPAEGSGPAGGGLAGDGLAGGRLAGGDRAGGDRAGGGLEGRSSARAALMNSLGLPTADLRGVLMGSSFFYARPLDEDGEQPEQPDWLGQWSAWGETAATWFSGADGPLSIDGEVATAVLGVDSRWSRWLAGVTVSYSEGEGLYTHPEAAGGAVTSRLTSLNPYVHYRINEHSGLWGVVGYGVGGMTLTPERAQSGIETGLVTAMAAFGGRGVLSVRSARVGAFELAVISDALVTNTVSESTENLMGAAGATSRVRLMLEGSGSMQLASGGVLTPTLEAGLRYDGGDAEAGAGIELGGGLGYAAGLLTVEVKGRMLLAHEDTEYEEWGLSGSIRYQPQSDGRGLSMNLGSAWGATQGGVQSLWSVQDASELARGAAMNAGQRFQVEIGYGFGGREALAGGKADALWVPFLGAEAADGGAQSLRMGVKLTSSPNVEMNLEFARRENGMESPEHAMQFNSLLRW